MPGYPIITFNTISAWENYLNTEVTANGVQHINGPIGNAAYNGAVTFIKKSPLNWAKVAIYSGGGDIVLGDNFLGTALFMTITPGSLTWGDNFYNEYVLINMTALDITLLSPLVYFKATGASSDVLPANSIVNIFKAANDLWIGTEITGGGGGGSVQKQPKTYVVGVTVGAPIAGTNTWTLPIFQNSYVVLFINRLPADLEDAGDGNPYITKALASDTLQVNNYPSWFDGDVLTYILITP